MKRKLRYFCTLLLMAVVGVAWAQTQTLSATNLELSGSYTQNTSKVIDGITYVFTDLMKNSSNIQAKANSGTIRNTTAFPGDIVSVAITHSGTARATTINGSTNGTDWVAVATGSGTITADFSGKGYKYFQITRGSNAAYWTDIKITYSSGSSTALATTTTIDASGITNTDVYTSTAAGSLSATVTETESGNPISGATVTWSSSDESIATIDQNGVVTLVGTGNTTITASYAGVENTYKPSSTTYQLDVISTEPSIVITDLYAQQSVSAGGTIAPAYITVEYQNVNIEAITPSVKFYEGDGVTETTCDWITVNIDDDKNVEYAAQANTGAARTAYLKVHATLGNTPLASNLVTITQAAWVADYATLPFEWAGGTSSALGELAGVTAFDLGADYVVSHSPYQIKFDNTDDYIQVKCDQQPGKVTIGVKMIGGANTSSIKVQGSVDGVTFTDIETLSISGSQNSILTLETTQSFAATDRYVRLVFTKGSNVGVGPITIAGVSTDPIITVNPDEVSVDATAQSGTLTLTYKNFEVTSASDFDIVFCNAEGNELQGNRGGFTVFSGAKKRAPQTNTDGWLTAKVEANATSGYKVSYSVTANTSTEARTAYFKVKANNVLSNLVTVTQAAYVPVYTVNFSLDGGTFVPNDDFTDEIVEIEAGTYLLPSATKDGFTFTGWSDGTNTYAAGDQYEVTVDVDFTAQWTERGSEQWVLTALEDLTANDVFVIVGNNGSNYAMSNNGGTGSAPEAVAVSVINNALADVPAAKLQWNLSVSNGAYTFYPNGTTETWLYCTNSNNGVRVGRNAANTFTVSGEGYLVHSGTSRYVGIYDSQDWRCYALGSNGAFPANIKDQTFAFYKKVSETVALTIKEGFPATTFSSTKAVDFSTVSGLTAFVITDASGATAEVSQVPAGEGVYVEGAAGTYYVPVIENAAAITQTNLLVGTGAEAVNLKEKTDGKTYYIFGKQDEKFAFFKVGENSPEAQSTVSAGKAYLRVPMSSNVAPAMIMVNGGGTTAIDNLQFTIYNLDGDIFDLQGRKVQNIQKGIYIVNGRKVVIR